MLQTYSPSQESFYEGRGQDAGLQRYLDAAKRRLLYFLVPFAVVLVLGGALVAVQRPLYRSEGKILVETQDIPVDLVKPTITDTANQRIQVIQQRITTRDNLLQIVKKFGLFATQQQWMTPSQILDLMKERTELTLVDLTQGAQQNNLTVVFTLSFEYENPEIARQVANEFLTLILNEDARNRANRAAETSRFLEQEVKRLQGVVASLRSQITEATLKPQDPIQDVPEQLKQQRAELARLKMDLVQKLAVYSSNHPEVTVLKKRIAALEKMVAKAPEESKPVVQADNGVDVLRQQLDSAVHSLDEANSKLSAARLGESLERNQQSERLLILDQPVVPNAPAKPNRPKLYLLSFILALAAGFGTVMAIEALDKCIHSSQQLAGIVDGRLIVSIPYISTQAETRQRKTRLRILLGGLALMGLVCIGIAVYVALTVDLSSIIQQTSWIDRLTRLSK